LPAGADPGDPHTRETTGPLSVVPASACEEHVALALEVASKSIVLAQNRDESLPWRSWRSWPHKMVLVLGSLADADNTGDHGSSRVFPPYVVTPLQGLRAALAGSGVEVCHYAGRSLRKAESLARRADALLVVAGCGPYDEGEYLLPLPFGCGLGGDRTSLELHTRDARLIAAVGPLVPRSAVVLIGGSAIHGSTRCTPSSTRSTPAWRAARPSRARFWARATRAASCPSASRPVRSTCRPLTASRAPAITACCMATPSWTRTPAGARSFNLSFTRAERDKTATARAP
jgi:hypothetical protein